jgi:hypothetical protein
MSTFEDFSPKSDVDQNKIIELLTAKVDQLVEKIDKTELSLQYLSQTSVEDKIINLNRFNGL